MSVNKQVKKKKKGQPSTSGSANNASRRPMIKPSDLVTDLIDLTKDYELKHGIDVDQSKIFVRLLSGQVIGVFPVEGEKFRNHLRILGETRLGRGPTPKVIDEVIQHIEARGLSLTSCPMFRRFAHIAGTIYIDRGTPDGEAIMITKQGWSLVQDPPVLFRRSNTTGVLPQPQVGGSLELFRSHFLTVPDESIAALLGFIVSCYLHKGSFPILMIQGQQGCGKSTLTDLLRSLIDPVLGYAARAQLPAKPEDLATVVSTNFLSSFDNASRIPNEIADILCQVSTGGNYGGRKLYSQGETFSMELHNPLIINSVSLLLERPDLASRLILIDLASLKDGERMSEGEVRRRFDSNLPKILEYICTAIAMALRDHADTRVSPTPRLADAALFATAAEPALGLLDGSIVTAWSSAQLDHTGNQAANDPVAFVLQKLLHDAPHCFEGTTSELIQKAHSLGADEKWKLPSDFPVKASGLGAYLTRNKSVLESSGLTVQKTPRQSKKRELKICFNEIKQTATSAVTVNRPNGHIEVVKINEHEALLNKLETAKRPHINPTHSGLGGMAA